MDKVVHFEIPADDMARAKKFYQAVFGWGIMDIPQMNYTMVTTVPTGEDRMPKESGAINGGMETRKYAGHSPMIVISVRSVDEYARKVEQNGGKIFMPKVAVGDMGFYARVTDTEGNVVGIWEDVKK